TAARRWLGDTLAGKHSVLVVDTNEQTARLNADLRAELVALGKVTEHGLRLGREGTWAGVGDLVRARRLAWELLGYQGNTAAPITQEQYRVLETREDGSMVVAPIRTTAGTPHGETLGARMTLPASYVTADLTLGYAVTGHGAEGLTVDTDYSIATPATRAEALYPAATRGRESNTIIVVTQTAPAPDAATGETAQAIRRDPRAVLGTILDNARRDRSATAEAAESAAVMSSVKTAGAMFAEVAAQAATERTAGWLDALVDTGALTEQQRQRIAAEDGAASLGRILRRVELAGHDPHQVLADAISERDLDGARQLTNVIHTRIVAAYRDRLDPDGHSYQQWLPTIDRADTSAYLQEIAAAADARRDELGAHLVTDPPRWALDAFGPVPDDPTAQLDWQTRAGIVAGHRELSDHDDTTTPIGPAPAPGLVEAHASWRAAWRALGRPDTDRDEAEMTDGRLRLRVRAYQREQSWAPRRVDNELAGTIQARDHHRGRATRRAAAAEAATDQAEHATLGIEAEQASALADTLDDRIGQLEKLERQRGMWLAHTAGTRAAAERAALELANRRAVDEHSEPEVTAAEWLTARREAEREDEAHREITPADMYPADIDIDIDTDTDSAELERVEVGRDRADNDDRDQRGVAAERGDESAAMVPDIRAVAQDEPDPVDEHTVRVPTAEETAESIRRAQRALVEIAERDAADQARATEAERAAQLARWHADDTQKRDGRGDERQDTASDAGPTLEWAGSDG
ncbi:MAG TPA: TrwC relaxase, partial [Pseudonocardia sp.]